MARGHHPACIPLRAGLLSVLALLALASCGESGPPPPTASPASPTLSPPITPDSATVTPIPPPPSTDYRLLYREFGPEQDTIWRVLPSDPSQREEIAVIPHRPQWGIIPSLSPDGKRLAYTTFPERASDESFQSEAYLLDLESGKTELVARGVDLQLRPLWSPDGEILYLRRIVQLEQEVIIFQVRVPKEEQPGEDDEEDRITPILKADLSDVLSFIPIGFAGDKRSMYFVQIQGPGSGLGTVLGAYAPATIEAIATAEAEAEATATAVAGDTPSPTPTPQVTLVVRLSGQIARDYDLSPDSRRLAFLVQELVEGQFVARAFVADLPRKSVQPLPVEGLGAGDHLRPLWHPDGGRVSIGLLPSSGEPGAVALVPLDGGKPSFLPPPDRGFDVPLRWAPDGAYLAVTSFEGDSLANPGKARLVLVAPTGHRLTVAEGADLEVVGWLKAE